VVGPSPRGLGGSRLAVRCSSRMGDAILRDIRKLTDSPEEYAAELRRRWGGLLSYRYIGRNDAQMDVGPVDNTVTIRRDMRNGAGGLRLAVLGIASKAATCPTWRQCRTR